MEILDVCQDADRRSASPLRGTKMSDKLEPVPFLKKWFKYSLEVISSKYSEMEFKDSGHGSAYLDLDTDSHISRITVWNHARCIEIPVLCGQFNGP